MTRINIPSFETSPLEAIHKQLGVVPNLFRLIGNSSVALSAFSAFQGTLSKSLDVKTRERIALAIAQVNRCDYCLSAHTYLGLNLAKISQEEIMLSRQGGSGDSKANAAVQFAVSVAKERGHISSGDIAKVRDAGYSDAQLVEIVALVAENSFTNYLNEVAKTEIDFPVIRADDLK